jgi:hypothetical protein
MMADVKKRLEEQADAIRRQFEQQAALREWLTEFEWSHFVTISFNQATTDLSAHRELRRVHQRLDQKLFGRRFYKRPDVDRTFFIALPEVASSLHYHALFRVPYEKHQLFETWAPVIVKNIAKASSCDVTPVRSQFDKERIASYITKDAYASYSIENFIVSSEFNRRRVTVNPIIEPDSPVSVFASSIR